MRKLLLFFFFLNNVFGNITLMSQIQEKEVMYKILNLPTVDLENFPVDIDGWTILFDGHSFKGWRGYNRTDIPLKWVVEDGTIHLKGTGTGQAGTDGGDLIFAYKFKNFELELEWKASKSANSGISYLLREVQGEYASMSAPEYQLLDNENHPDAKEGKDGNRQSASLYDLIPAKPQNAKPYGQWNKVKIVCDKGSITHFQNDVAVVKYDLWTSEWEKLLNSSKFSKETNPLAYELLRHCGGERREGFIGFQDHGYDVWFRNIRIRLLE